MRLAIILAFTAGLLLVDPVCRGLAAASTGEVKIASHIAKGERQ